MWHNIGSLSSIWPIVIDYGSPTGLFHLYGCRSKGLRFCCAGDHMKLVFASKEKPIPSYWYFHFEIFISYAPLCILTPDPSGTVLNQDYNMTYSIAHRECQYSPHKIGIWCSRRDTFRVLLPLLRHEVPINHGRCRLTMPIVALVMLCITILIFIGVFKSV